MSQDETHTLQKQDKSELDQFQVEIQQVTEFVKDPEQKLQQHTIPIETPYSPSFTTPSFTSEPSQSYSTISDYTYIHGATFSTPKVSFRESAIPTVLEIHELLTTRHHTLFFIPEPDEHDEHDSDCDPDNPKNQKKKQYKKKHQGKLQRSLSERGLTFAISEGHVYFDWGVFIREYLYNFFNILVLPVILYMENKSGAQSRLYWPCNWNIFLYFIFFQLIGFVYVNIIYFHWIEGKSRYSLPLLVYNVLYLSRITVVAIKWAYLPPQIFQMMRKKKLTDAQFQMIHLLSGWVTHKNKTGLAREIGQCCARLELDINQLKFAFRDESRQKSKSHQLCLQRNCNTWVTYGNLLIPYVVFCASRYLSKNSFVFSLTSMIVSPIICVCPLIARTIEFSSFHEFKTSVHTYQVVWYCVLFVTNAFNLQILIKFSAVIASDFKRRYHFVWLCTRLIELKKDAFQYFDDYKEHLFPDYTDTKQGRKLLKEAVIETLDLSDAETMYNWSKLRAFFLDFGLRFLRREEAILGYFTLSILLIVAFYITVLYLDLPPDDYWETAIYFDTVFVTCTSIAVLTPAFSALRHATKINQKVSEQRSILADKRLRLENERLHMDMVESTVNEVVMDKMSQSDEEYEHKKEVNVASTASSIARASVMLDKIIKMLEVDRFRIRLLGYTVDTTVTGIIAAVVGAVGFLVARLLLGKDAEGIPDT